MIVVGIATIIVVVIMIMIGIIMVMVTVIVKVAVIVIMTVIVIVVVRVIVMTATLQHHEERLLLLHLTPNDHFTLLRGSSSEHGRAPIEAQLLNADRHRMLAAIPKALPN